MRGTRTYPDEPAEPFPRPPTTVEDKEGREITVDALESDESVVDALTAMYVQFDPADRAQGIPPTGETAIRRWLDPIVANGINVASHHADLDTEPSATNADGYVGHATLVPDTDDPQTVDDPGTIEWELAIFVLQAYQRAGIGTALLETLLGHASELGVERVWLTVERWNGPAIALYERVGFETCGSESFDREMSIRLAGDGE